MSREVCGICWCPYDEETGACGCEPALKEHDMTTLRTAAQQALEALERYQVKRQDFDRFADEVTALRAALAEPEHKPIPLNEGRLWQYSDGNIGVGTPAEPCPCGDRSAAECPGEWEPGCDLGNNPKYAKRVNLAEPVQEPQCNPHPKAPHSFMRNASHNEDRYVCECEGWEPYEAGYQAGMEAALRAQS